MMNQYAVIVDFSHLFHLSRAAALNAGPEYDLAEVTITNVVGKLRTVRAELGKENIVGYDLVFAEDRKPLHKLELLPGYRANRKDCRDEKEVVKQYLLENGKKSTFCFAENNEADDVIASLVKLALQQEGLFVIIVSSDRDLWQLLGDRVTIFNPIKREFVTSTHVADAFKWPSVPDFKCRPAHIPLIKALWGDSGDCVPNVVPRTQKHFLPAIMETEGDIVSFKSLVDTKYKYYLSQKAHDAFYENWANVERNWQLVKLDDNCQLAWTTNA